VVDTMTYDASVMSTWAVFTIKGVKTAWHKKNTWMVMLQLTCVSFFVAILVLTFLSDPRAVDSSKFTSISVFLSVFVALLQGFFLASSVTRWYECTNGFLELFDAVRNLQVQFFALGVTDMKRFQCTRYGVLSGFLLSQELRMEGLPIEEREGAIQKLWMDLEVDEEPPESMGLSPRAEEGSSPANRMYITKEESAMLQTVEEPAGMPWVWVASLVGRMAQDGDIPPMASPTYGRIMNLAQNAHQGIRQVKQSISVQAPFVYIHVLATLVHVNNIINAFSFGLTLGATLGTYMMRGDREFEKWLIAHPKYRHEATERDLTADVENLVVIFFISMLGALVYQALLDVSISIAQPFVTSEGEIPVDRLLTQLQQDLADGWVVANNLPSWEKPRFKKP